MSCLCPDQGLGRGGWTAASDHTPPSLLLALSPFASNQAALVPLSCLLSESSSSVVGQTTDSPPTQDLEPHTVSLRMDPLRYLEPKATASSVPVSIWKGIRHLWKQTVVLLLVIA